MRQSASRTLAALSAMVAVLVLVGRAEGLEVGDRAPDFELPAADGGIIRLSDLLGENMVLIEFYHSDWGPNCTANLKQRRDDFELFEALDIQVIGISMSHTYSQAAFADSLGLNFPLLSDFPHGRTIRSYEIGHEEGEARRLYARPSFFLIDREGIIRAYWGQRPMNPDEILPPDPLVSSQPILEMAQAILRE